MQATYLFLFFGTPSWLELFVIGGAALMIFGSQLPEVALRAVAHVMRARRAVTKMWRDTGLEEELRRVRRDIELSIPREADFQVKPAAQINDARAAAEKAREAAERSARAGASGRAEGADGDAGSVDAGSVDPDHHRRGEVTLQPAEGAIASGDWSLDDEASIDRDMTPGADRQEETYSDGGYPGQLAGGDAGGDAEDEAFEGDHFGAGLQAPQDPPKET